LATEISGMLNQANFTHEARIGDRTKRIFDVVFAAIALVALLPLFGMSALLVKCGSHGPVFFRYKRVGFDGRPYLLLQISYDVCRRGASVGARACAGRGGTRRMERLPKAETRLPHHLGGAGVGAK
jgi:hypothetical protein